MILSKPYKNNLLKRIGAQLKAAREQAGIDINRAVKLTQHKPEHLAGLEAGEAEAFMRMRVDRLVFTFAVYGKEMVVSTQELPLEERYYNLQFYGKTELQNFLNSDQNIIY